MSLGLSTWRICWVFFVFFGGENGCFTWKDLFWLVSTCRKLLGDWVAPFQKTVLSGTRATFFCKFPTAKPPPKKKTPPIFITLWRRRMVVSHYSRTFCQKFVISRLFVILLYVCKPRVIVALFGIINQATWFVMASGQERLKSVCSEYSSPYAVSASSQVACLYPI